MDDRWRNISSTLEMDIPEMNLTALFSVPVNDSMEEKRRIYNAYTLNVISFYMDFFLFVVAAFGVPGNVASIFTIISLPTVSSSKVHVAVLAVTDTIAILLKIFYREVSARGTYISLPGHSILSFLLEFFTVYANWVVVAMTAERFLAVCFPLRVGRMYTRRKAVIVLALLGVTTAGINLFHLWAWEEIYADGGYWYSIKPEYEAFVGGVFYYVSGCHYVLLPCVLIFTGNALIIVSVRQARAAQRHLTNSVDQGGRKAKDQRQITVMLIVVSVVFLILNTPNAFFYFFKKYWVYEELTYSHAQYVFTVRFFHCLADANHAVNFYLYFLSMSSFRRRFLDSVRCRANGRYGHTRSSVYRTSQTYLHSLHQTGGDFAGRSDVTSYSAFNKHCRMDSGHSNKGTNNGGCNNNKAIKSMLKQDSQNFMTANSNV